MKKTKKFFLATIMTIVCLFLCVDFHGFQDLTPKSLTQIDMYGRLVQSRTRNSDNFIVFLNCKSVQINFIRTLGALEVSISKEDSVHYQSKLNAVGGTRVAIETSTWKEGKYVISVCDGLKNCAYGNFTLKREEKNSEN